jgi:hypothetical protein
MFGRLAKAGISINKLNFMLKAWIYQNKYSNNTKTKIDK